MAITAQQKANLLGVTSFMFNFAPDQASFARFEKIIEANPSFYALGTNLARTEAYTSQFAEGATRAEKIDLILGRLGLTEGEGYERGVNFINQRLDAGIPEGQVLMEIGEKLLQETPPAGLEDAAAILRNKIDASEAYLESGIEGYSSETLPDLLANITADAASVEEAKAAIDEIKPGVPGDNVSLTADVDDLTGTANDDTFTAGLTVAGSETLQDFDSIDGGEGTDSLTATLTGDAGRATPPATAAVAPTLTSVENIFARSVTGANTLDLANAEGYEQLWSNGSQQNLTFDNVSEQVTVGARNIAQTAGIIDVDVNYDANTLAADDTQAIVLEDANVDVDINQGGANTATDVRNISIASTGSSNTLRFVNTDVVTGAEVQNLTITGEGDLTIAAGGNAFNDITAGTIDASEATGDVSITIADAAATNLAAGVTERTVTMGAGDDTVNAAAADLADSKVDGGAGRDTIVVDGTSGSLVNDLVANVSNFEVINLSGLTNAAGDVSYGTMANIGAEALVVTDAAAGTAANAGTVNNLTAESDLTLVNTNGDADSITLEVAGADTNDNAELNFATVGADGNNSTFNVTVADVENLNVSTSATDADTFRSTELSVDSTALENLTVTGNEAVVFTQDTTAGTGNIALESVDVSGVTASNATAGDLTATITVGNGVTVIGSAGDDSITFGESGEITGGAGEDVFVATLVSATDAGVPRFSTITDLNADEDDSVEFGTAAGATVLSTATGGADVNVITEADLGLAPGVNATFADFLNAASEAFEDGAGGAATLSGFEFAGNTYLVEDNTQTTVDGSGAITGGNTFDATADFIVELTGSVDLTEFTYA